MKTALVTGGSRGIGKGIVKIFLNQGWRVITCSRFEAFSQKNIISYQVDLGIRKERRYFLRSIEPELTGMKLLILNAAVTGVPYIDEKKCSPRYVRNVNVTANKELLEKALPHLEKNNGVVIFVSSNMVNEKSISRTEFRLYRKTKMDFEKIFKAIARGNPKVNFVTLNPGKVSGEIHKKILTHATGLLLNRTIKAEARGNLRDPKDVALFLKKYIDEMRFAPECNYHYFAL